VNDSGPARAGRAGVRWESPLRHGKAPLDITLLHRASSQADLVLSEELAH